MLDQVAAGGVTHAEILRPDAAARFLDEVREKLRDVPLALSQRRHPQPDNVETIK